VKLPKIRGTNNFLHDLPLFVHQVRGGRQGHIAPVLGQFARGVQSDVEWEFARLCKIQNIRGGVIGHGHSDESEALPLVTLESLDHLRHFGHAACATGGPEIYQSDLAIEILFREGFAREGDEMALGDGGGFVDKPDRQRHSCKQCDDQGQKTLVFHTRRQHDGLHKMEACGVNVIGRTKEMRLESKNQNTARQGRLASCAAALLASTIATTACTPPYNWRSVALADVPLEVQLPCKPNQKTQTVPMGKGLVDLHAVGCEQAKVQWSVMAARLAADDDAKQVLAQWKELTLQHMQAQAVQGSEKQQAVQSAVFVVGADAQKGTAHATWRVVQLGQETYIVQAMALYQDRENNKGFQEARANFHDNIRQQTRP
jgi:hypothetical protein